MAWNAENYHVMIFGIVGQPTANHFLPPGVGATSAAEIQIAPPGACRLVEARVICRVAPGGAFVDTYTARVTGVGSACAPTVTAAAVTGTWTGAIDIAEDDVISIQYTQTGGVATRDPFVTLILRIQE